MSRAIAEMDAPLRAAVAKLGGRRPFFRALGLTQRPGWARVPQGRLFEVARVTGLTPEQLRPDLADWIAAETARRDLAAAAGADLGAAVETRWNGPQIEEGLVDLWSCLASVQFVARLRQIKPQQVYAGRGRACEAARAYAMALANVVGRARPTHIANVFQCSRQNVDNAAARYLRARDGDDPEDWIKGQFSDGPRVWETGSNRLRRVKSAVDGLWDVERQFERFLTAETLTLPQPQSEKRRA